MLSARTTGSPTALAGASADPCVNIFVRSSRVDGREVVSVDLHGDGLIKGAVPPYLARELLARAGPATDPGGAHAACVPPALAQGLFDPVINVAGFDSAMRLARVGDRWVLASSKAPVTQERVQLAAAGTTTKTRGAGKPTAKKKGAPAILATRVAGPKPGATGKTGDAAPRSLSQISRVSSP